MRGSAPQIESWRAFLADVRAAPGDRHWKNQPGVKPEQTNGAVDTILKDDEAQFEENEAIEREILKEKVVDPAREAAYKASADAYVAGSSTVGAAVDRTNDGTPDGRRKALATLRSFFDQSWKPIRAPISISWPKE